MTIDCHTHVIPPSWIDIEDDHAFGMVVVRDKPFRRVRQVAWDWDARRQWLATQPVPRQLVSPMPELFGYWAEPSAAAESCRRINEWIADGCREHPDVFTGLGIVPLQDPALAAAVVRECAAMGLAGIEVGTNVNGVPIHDRRFDEVWAEADRLGMVVFVHAFHPHGIDTIRPELAGNGVLFPTEIGAAGGGLLVEGAPDRFPTRASCSATRAARWP